MPARIKQITEMDKKLAEIKIFRYNLAYLKNPNKKESLAWLEHK